MVPANLAQRAQGGELIDKRHGLILNEHHVVLSNKIVRSALQ